MTDSHSTPTPPQPRPEPPPRQPDRELIGYLERGNDGPGGSRDGRESSKRR